MATKKITLNELRNLVKQIIKEESKNVLIESKNKEIKDFLLENEKRIKNILIKVSKNKNGLWAEGENFINNELNLNYPVTFLGSWNTKYFRLILDNNCNIIGLEVYNDQSVNREDVISLKVKYDLFNFIIKSAGKNLESLYSEDEEFRNLMKKIEDFKDELTSMDGYYEPGYDKVYIPDEDTGEFSTSINRRTPLLNKDYSKIIKLNGRGAMD